MLKVVRSHFTSAEALALLAEAGSLLVAFWIASEIALRIAGQDSSFGGGYGPTWLSAAIFATVILAVLYFHGLYDFDRRISATLLWIKLFSALAVSGVVLFLIHRVAPFFSPGVATLAPAMGLSTTFLLPWRHLTMAFVWRRVFAERILIVGSDDASLSLARAIEARGHEGYSVVGFFGDPRARCPGLDSARIVEATIPVLQAAQAAEATKVVVAQRDNRGQLGLDDLLACKTAGIRVERASEFYQRLTGRVLLDDVRIKSWLVFGEGFLVSRSALLIKRIGDLMVAAVGLVLASPLMAVVAVMVRLESPGPVLFRQERVGLNGKPFVLWKFRSMRSDAERDGKAQWATRNDSRVTRVGHLLRLLRLDELPQLWNVLRGDMSMVGPRPEREEFVRQLTELSPMYPFRLAVRPGITGWAQVKGSYAGSLEESLEKLSFDLFYIKNISFFFDLSILASTVRIVLFGRGAR